MKRWIPPVLLTLLLTGCGQPAAILPQIPGTEAVQATPTGPAAPLPADPLPEEPTAIPQIGWYDLDQDGREEEYRLLLDRDSTGETFFSLHIGSASLPHISDTADLVYVASLDSSTVQLLITDGAQTLVFGWDGAIHPLGTLPCTPDAITCTAAGISIGGAAPAWRLTADGVTQIL